MAITFKYYQNVKLPDDETSLNCNRFVTHIYYFIHLLLNQELNQNEDDKFLFYK